MSQTANTPQPVDAVAGLNFEQALTRLEQIVESMESGDLPLETMLERFEEGTKLVKVCQTKIAEAEVKIQKLEQSASGDLTAKPIDLA